LPPTKVRWANRLTVKILESTMFKHLIFNRQRLQHITNFDSASL